MFYIGEILKTRGNNGEVVLRTSPDFIFAKSIRSIQLISKKYTKVLSVENIIEAVDDLIIKFEDIDDISQAYRLIGYKAYFEDKYEIKEFRKDNLVGYSVIDVDGNSWGKIITDVKEGLTHILEVDDNDDIVLIPYSDKIIQEINDAEKKIIIDPPDGLRNLNK